MLTQQPSKKYCITPSMLDAFQLWRDSDIIYEQYYGRADEPSKTAEQFALELETRLINQINRCPNEPNEAADKGTCLNELVDMLIQKRNCTYSGMGVSYKDNAYIATLNGYTFKFSEELIRRLAAYFHGAISQYRCEAPIQTDFGLVILYGYLDEWCADKVYDIKTTSQYEFGKYARRWQRHLYPYTLIESGMATEVREFEYTAVKLFNTVPISGEIYPEVYTYNHEYSRIALQGICELFIQWLESRKEYITDQRIFGGENPDGYVGKKILLEF